MSKLEKYPAYKESGVEWLGEIPEGWDIQKLKYITQLVSGFPFSSQNFNDLNGISVIRIGDIKDIININKCIKSTEENIHENTKIHKFDTLIALSGATTGKSCFLNKNIDNAYINQRIAKFNYFNSFLFYCIANKKFKINILLGADGSAQENISNSTIENMFIPYPPKQEQIKIASFLDEKTSQLDIAIQQKEQLIKLLKERQQILINDAVTKGLDKTVAMKDSNFQWLGKIPKHWEVKALKYSLKERIELSDTGNETLFMMSQVHGLVVRSDYHAKAVVAQSSIGNKRVYKNDLVFNKLKAHLGVFSKSNINEVGIVSPDYAVYYATGDIKNVKYLEHLFKTQIYISHFISKATGVVEGLIRLYTDDLFSLKVPIPPKIEQEAILTYIEKNNQKIDKAINLQQQQITKLKEYKASLIDSVVTGKVRVEI